MTRLLVVLCALSIAGCGSEPLAFAPYEATAPIGPEPAAPAGWRTDRSDELTAHNTLPVLYAHPFLPNQTGYTAGNPIHNLAFELTAEAVAVSHPEGAWSTTWTIEGHGRSDWMEPVFDTLPKLAGCYGGGCVERLEYRRGHLVEWYVNTLHGLAQGFDILQRPPGQGLLFIEGRLEGSLQGEVRDAGQTIVMLSAGQHAFAYGTLAAMDIDGRSLPSAVVWEAGSIRLQIDDRSGRYPIRVRTNAGDCPSAWCADGDPSTVDICTLQGQTCIRALDLVYEGRPCGWGAYCCPGGFYHPACGEEPR